MDPLPRELDAAYCEARNQMRKLDQEPSLRGILYRTVVQHGTASDVVSSIIDHEKADLLVVGTEGRTGFTKMALGSVAEELLRVANCPVLSVSRIAAAVPELANFKTIVFATDFGPASERAFQYAARIADHFKAKLMLLHTVSPIPEFEPVPGYMPPATAVEAVKQWEHRVRDEALSKLKVLASSYSKSLETTYTVTIDFSPTAILDFVARHTPELLVMGAQRVQSPRLVAHLPWGVLHGVLSGTPCPVLTILG
jgi:nucleotide-binding universal stress UspA family protein